jgi:hypothetical protein
MGNLSCINDGHDDSLQSPRVTPGRRSTKYRITPLNQQCQRIAMLEGHSIPIIVVKIFKPDLLEVTFKTNSAGQDTLHHRFVSGENLPASTTIESVRSLIRSSSRTTVSVMKDLGCVFIGKIMLTIDNITTDLFGHLMRLSAMTRMVQIQSANTPNLQPHSRLDAGFNSSLDDSCELPGGSDTDRTEAKERVSIRDIMNPSEYPSQPGQPQQVIVHTPQSIHLPQPSVPPVNENANVETATPSEVTIIHDQPLQKTDNDIPELKVLSSQLIDPLPLSDTVVTETEKPCVEFEIANPICDEAPDDKDEQLISKSIDRFDLIDNYP